MVIRATQDERADQRSTRWHEVRKPERERWRYAQREPNTSTDAQCRGTRCESQSVSDGDIQELTPIRFQGLQENTGPGTLCHLVEWWLRCSCCVEHIAIAHALAFAPCADFVVW